MDPPKINYLNSNTLMVINTAGKIRELYTPFKVQVLTPIKPLQNNSMVFVEEVQLNAKHRLIYRIADNWYPYYIFKINCW
jgi:hypothetical protein